MPPAVAAALAQVGLPDDALAAIALPLTTRWARPWQFRASQPMQPGSMMKLVTTVVALDRLGPNHRGRTELFAAGPIDGELLAGDLVLKGGADPELGLPALWQMLFELRQRGVREIGGDLVLDRSLFRPARIDIGLAPFDESPEWPYNMIPDALMLSGNLLSLALVSTDAGVQARLTPPLEGIELDASAITLTDTPCADWGKDWLPAVIEAGPGAGFRIGLRGGFPRRCEARRRTAIARPRCHHRAPGDGQLWASLGGTWRKPPGGVREGDTPTDATSVAVHVARPWGEVLRPMNKQSDNALARLLFLPARPGRDGRRTRTRRRSNSRAARSSAGSTNSTSTAAAWCSTTARACRAANASRRARWR